MEKSRRLGAECGVGVFALKNKLGIKRLLPRRPGKLPLRASNPPKRLKFPLEEISRSRLKTPPRRS